MIRPIVPRLLAAVVLVLCFSPSGRAEDGAVIDPARMAAAKDMMDAVGTTKQLDAMMSAMAAGFSDGAASAQGPAAGAATKSGMDVVLDKFRGHREAMLDDFAAIYAQRFTAEELQTIAAFYRSGPGAKFVTAMPELMQAGQTIGGKYAQMVLEELKADDAAATKP
ncbi:MAG: DUF2059 domain-containing protein [Hyphomicrobium sp.]